MIQQTRSRLDDAYATQSQAPEHEPRYSAVVLHPRGSWSILHAAACKEQGADEEPVAGWLLGWMDTSQGLRDMVLIGCLYTRMLDGHGLGLIFDGLN